MTLSPSSAQRQGDFAPPDAHRGDPLESERGDRPEILRVIAVGSIQAVNHHVLHMYHLGYAQPHEWSRAIPTVNPNEVMRILTKRLMGLQR